MKKKCVVIYFKGAPVILADVQELEPAEFVKIRNECAANFAALVQKDVLEKANLDNRIKELEKEIRILKGEEE